MQTALACTSNGDIVIYDYDSGSAVQYQNFATSVFQISVQRNTGLVAAATLSASVIILNANLSLMSPLPSHKDYVVGVAFSPSGDLLASYDIGGTVVVQVAGGKWSVVSSVQAHTQTINAIDFSLDGAEYVTISADATVKQWSVSSGILRTLNLLVSGESVLYSKFQPLILAGDVNGDLFVWNATSGARVLSHMSAHNGVLSCLAESADGTMFASGGFDALVHFWNARTFALVGSIKFLSGTFVSSLSFAPDGDGLLISTGTSLFKYRLATRVLSFALPPSSGEVSGIAFDS